MCSVAQTFDQMNVMYVQGRTDVRPCNGHFVYDFVGL